MNKFDITSGNVAQNMLNRKLNLESELTELKDKLHRRNLQIKELRNKVEFVTIKNK